MSNWQMVSEEKNGDIIVGFPFSEFGKDAPEFIEHNNKKYKRDMIEIIEIEQASRFCSCRRYVEINPVPYIEPKMGYGSGGELIYI